MIKVEQIYEATHRGLDIILDLYPQAKDCVGVKNKHFAIRNEKTPSACLRQVNGIWKVTDFGGEGRAESPIDLYMHETGIYRFNEAILQLAAKYGVTDELNRNVNRPDFSERPARVDERDGQRYFEFNDSFSDYELKVLGPLVTQNNTDELHWHSVKAIRYIKDRVAKIKSSNEHYPIFARECLVKPAENGQEEVKFFKIYEPLNFDKAWRFSYWPEGIKPKNYINGLSELKQAYHDFNAKEMAIFEKTRTNEDECYKEQKLPVAIICSGERDSLCVKSLGYHPLWFNSETYRLSETEYNEIMKYVDVLYNIPDIDETGVHKGTELALRFIDIHTIWLPEWLRTYHDNRGKARKDFRDWIEIRQTKKDFKKLMVLAMPARFWTSKFNTKTNKWDHAIDTACLYYFLKLNGYYALHDENSITPQYIHIEGNIVERITTRDIRDFVRKWVVERAETRDVLNLILNTPKLSAASLDSLQEIDLDFTSYTQKSQLFFFPKVSIEILPGEMKEYKQTASTLNNYVWAENVIQHNFKQLPPMFEIKRETDDEGHTHYDILIKNTGSKFFDYLVNTSRLYWRKELEYNFEDKTLQEKKDYHSNNRYRIDGEGLSEEEIEEQKMCLINKIFTIGYMMHRYKNPSRAWAPMALDNKIGELGECNGRSGKSFFFKTLSLFMKTVKLSGRNPKLMDNPHVFDQVDKHTQMLLVDDCDRYLNTGMFYDNITSDMTVNPKNNHSFTIPFNQSPKIAFTTNYVPADFDPSSEARLIYMVFSDYYHQRTEDNDYLESRSIHDDFGKNLYDEAYSEDEWNADINFMMQCCSWYLSLPGDTEKIQPPMKNIIWRKHKADMGANFEDWANSYFAPESGRLNTFVVRERAYYDFKSFSGVNKVTTQSITKKLKAFVQLCPWIEEMNPECYCNASGRILRRDENAQVDQGPVEMIYLKAVPNLDDFMKKDTLEEKGAVQTSFLPPGYDTNDNAPF